MAEVAAGKPAGDWRLVATGVRLEEPEDAGDWLADAAAFDSAGADVLWVDPDPAGGWDVLALAAGLAAVTFRSRLVVALPDADAGAPGPAAGRTLGTIARLSRGRLDLLTDAGFTDAGLELPGVRVFRRLPGEPGGYAGPADGAGPERWTSMQAVPDRAGWRAARAEAAADGVRGLVVPADPRLLDLLRNPDDPGGRRDLFLAQG